jgi:hypothetical protein
MLSLTVITFALVQIINNCTSAVLSLLAKIQIFELFDWLKFFQGNSQRNHGN